MEIANDIPRDLTKQPTPRKGTETKTSESSPYDPHETTHTPQGDGNLDGIEPVADLGRNNPHPARGRKRD